MHQIDLSPNDLAEMILARSCSGSGFLLDSCGVTANDVGRVYAALEPRHVIEIYYDAAAAMSALNDLLTGDQPSIFTISYDLGERLLGIDRGIASTEPDLFAAVFDTMFIGDHRSNTTFRLGHSQKLDLSPDHDKKPRSFVYPKLEFHSDMSPRAHHAAVLDIHERIRSGNTYQANLTRQLTADVPDGFDAADVFRVIRRDHAVPYAAFLARPDSFVISASPERFLHVDLETRRIVTSPIKGTRPRGVDVETDARMRADLLSSGKDIAENTMIVDLLRNDFGRICEFGSVKVERLCDLETHPTYFDLVSSITGQLRDGIRPADIIRAMFPCGSITGAPKLSTMRAIAEIEPSLRGLSMGSIGVYIPPGLGIEPILDMSVAIRTMTVSDGIARFNVGGGITIDSDPDSEFDETVVKAKALLAATNGIES